jgi:hypothetical protein
MIIINYVNSTICNLSDNILNTSEHFIDSDNVIQYGDSSGQYMNIDDSTEIYIMSYLNFFNKDNNIGKVTEYEFYSGNLSGSITPLLFEVINNNYKLVGVGTPFTPNKIGIIKNNFNLIMGTNLMERNRNYTFGWKNGTLTTNNSGIVGFNNDNTKIITTKSINITNDIINTILPITNIYKNRLYLIEFYVELEENISPITRTKYLYPTNDGIIIDLYGIKWRIKSIPNNDENYTIFADDVPIDSGVLIFRDSNYIVYVLKKTNTWLHSIVKNVLSPIQNNIPPSEYNPNHLQIINDEYKGWNNIISSKSTCGEENIKFKNVNSPKNCVMSLYKESGCKSEGTIFPSLINGELDKYKNMNINCIKSEFSEMSNSIYNGDDKYYSKCRAEPIITVPSGLSGNNNVNIIDLLPSSKTCGTDLQANINSIGTPDMCIQSLWKEAGCTSNGNLWNDISNGYFNSHSNGYWSNKKINDIKTNIADVYASGKFGKNVTDLCSPIPINKNNLVGINGNNLIINSDNDVNKYLINSVFKLKVNLPNINPLIANKNNFDDPNFFYLAVEELASNCSINENNVCSNIYVDNKKCYNKSLSEISRKNSFRFVLVPIDYVNNPNVKYGKNINFTIIKIQDKLYLKNVDTGYLPQLYKNDFNQVVVSNILSDETNIGQLPTNNNIVCNKTGIVENTPSNNLISFRNSDGDNYLLTTLNINKSNSIKLIYLNDKIQIKLQTYDSYGISNNNFTLVYCNYNMNSLQNIETSYLQNNIKYNLICFDDDNHPKLSLNKLNFSIEIIKFSDEYIKKMNVISISK